LSPSPPPVSIASRLPVHQRLGTARRHDEYEGLSPDNYPISYRHHEDQEEDHHHHWAGSDEESLSVRNMKIQIRNNGQRVSNMLATSRQILLDEDERRSVDVDMIADNSFDDISIEGDNDELLIAPDDDASDIEDQEEDPEADWVDVVYLVKKKCAFEAAVGDARPLSPTSGRNAIESMFSQFGRVVSVEKEKGAVGLLVHMTGEPTGMRNCTAALAGQTIDGEEVEIFIKSGKIFGLHPGLL
jgi:hypothetical protein